MKGRGGGQGQSGATTQGGVPDNLKTSYVLRGSSYIDTKDGKSYQLRVTTRYGTKSRDGGKSRGKSGTAHGGEPNNLYTSFICCNGSYIDTKMENQITNIG